MRTIAVFGITGRTGQPLGEMLLQEGFAVKALARNPSSLSLQHPNLTVLKGDVLQYEDVQKVVAGTDAIISVIGRVKDSPPLLQTNGTKNIIRAMQQHGVKRLISLTGGGVPAEQDQPKLPDLIFKFLLRTLAKQTLEDGMAHAEAIKNSSLDWTIVRGPRLTDGPLTKKYRVGWVGVNASTSVSRRDLAHFIVQELKENKFIRQMPFISK